MKNQYVGDINDYKKYGLLRCISKATDLRILVVWMLTPDDGSSDGKFIRYLSEPNIWSKFDPDLYSHLSQIMDSTERKIEHIEKSAILSKTKYFSKNVPDNAIGRDVWFSELLIESNRSNLVFLDPDNGIEVGSVPYGRKNSSKFVFWKEVVSLWKSGRSLLIYQHFIREERGRFTQRMLTALREATSCSYVSAFSTSHATFLLALQPEHHSMYDAIIGSVEDSWSGQINYSEMYE